MNIIGTRIGPYPVGASCPWRIVETEAAPAVSPAPAIHPNLGQMPITFGGHAVDAPGFTAESFERAMARAFIDDLQVKHLRGDEYLVHHAGVNGGYACTRERCTCKAGEVGTPCKHRTFLCAVLDIREPALRKQWADARKAVAA